MDAFNLLQQDTIDRPHLLGPWLQEGDLVMVYASRGVGKTRMAVRIAHACATESAFLKWTASPDVRIAYFDGEMGLPQIHRILQATEDATESSVKRGKIFFHCYDQFEHGFMPDLSQPEGQRKYDELAKGCNLIIIDNLLSCARPEGRNDSEVAQWGRIQKWLINKRRDGIAVLLVHHSGKSGDQLGTSVRENILDTVIRLDKSPLDTDTGSTAIELRFTKTRNFYGEDATPLYIHKETSPTGKDRFLFKSLEAARQERFLELVDEIGSSAARDYLGIGRGQAEMYMKGRKLDDDVVVKDWRQLSGGDDDELF